MKEQTLDTNPPSGVAWPANHRAALVVIIHVDAPGSDPAATGAGIGLDYTATGLQRLLKTLPDLDIPATMAWTALALATYPQLARAGQDAGLELAISRVGGNGELDQATLLSRISDIPLAGVVEALPGGEVDAFSETISPSRLDGTFSWRVSGAGGDYPVSPVAGDAPGAVIIPVSPYWIDATWLAPDRPLPPSSLLESWSVSLAAVRAEGGLMTVVLHPHIAGRPGFAGQVIRFLDEVIESGDVWIARAAQVAEWWRQSTRNGS